MLIMKPILHRALCLFILFVVSARGESMLQYFNTSWAEITRKMPELAEAGYQSLWLPPPTKGSGGLSVGYDCWDRFDLGSKDQRGSTRTRYGTEAELIEMVRVAHRFGIRVYFDNVMNHNAFDVPGFNASTGIDTYQGFVPEDFHLRRTEDGFYRKWDNTRDWNDAWQVQNLGLADLIDIATEPGPTNRNHGSYEGDTIPKIKFIRHPNNPEFYCYNASGTYVGFGTGNGLTAEYIQANPAAYEERVEDMLNRSARWQIDRIKADGFRLDAVKHTPADFFGATFGGDKTFSDYGYLGQAQRQFNITRGFSDADHRNSVFDTEVARDDAMMFGEHLGQPPAYSSYIDAGMRLVDNDLRSNLNSRLGSPFSGIGGFQNPGYGGFGPDVAVMHAQSHDSDYAARRELQHATYFTRAGLGLIYTDGNYHAETLGESGGAFPRHSNTAFLGQWGDSRIPNLLKLHQDFARGWQKGRAGTSDLITYERIDKRENGGMDDAAGTTMLVAINDNYSNGVSLTGGTSFPSAAGMGSENNPNTSDAYLFQYARGFGSQTGYYKYASDLGSVIVPTGSYLAFAPRTPEEANPWKNAGGKPITIYQNGEPAGSLTVTRRDGSDGDPAFNPYGVPDSNTSDYAYDFTLPRVTDSSALRFVVRTDGSTENLLLKLNGGIDLNGSRPDILNPGPSDDDPFYRDHSPAVSTDVFMGFEQASFVRRLFPEKFAAKEVSRNQTGSQGAETYSKSIGSPGFSIANGPAGSNNYDTYGNTRVSFIYHDPEAVVGGTPSGGWPGGSAPLQYVEDGGSVKIWAKPAGSGFGYRVAIYYTTDGSNPEGAGGGGTGSTKAVDFTYSHNDGVTEWWSSAEIPMPPSGTQLRYKIGVFKEGADSVYPSGPNSVADKLGMMTVFQIDNFNASSVVHAPHNDYGVSETGLAEGFHVLRARPFLKRNGKTSLYNTITQTFYYDAARPEGQIVFPSSDGQTIGGSEYGVVVRADKSTSEAWFKIVDGDTSNDDSVTGADNGNGTWVRATEVTPSANVTPSNPLFTREFRFNYVNIPATGNGSILVRLKEISSSADDELDDIEGHFTTLTRSVINAGPDFRMFVAWPPSDGFPIDDEYLLKTYFSKTLANGLNEADLKARFLVRYGSDDSWPNGVQVLDPAALSIIYNETADYHALSFKLPNLYDGRPGFLYRVEVTHDRPSPAADLTATRRVTFLPSSKPRVTILQPQEIGSDGKLVEIVLPDGPGPDTLDYTVRVSTDTTTTLVDLAFSLGTAALTPVDADPILAGIQPVIEGSSAIWDFIWTITAPGQYRLLATATSPTGTNTDSRNATVIRRQLVDDDDGDIDDDDDGLADFDEGTPTPLPNGFPTDDPRYQSNPEQWSNGDVHVHNAYGFSNPWMPDSDNDGLPDGLEVGWRTPGPDTDIAVDTNGDGITNFIGDLDPPFFNTVDNLNSVPGVNSASEGGDRAKRLRGSTTNPNNPDTDGDGLPDGIEDANVNGWVDGDGASLATNAPPTLGRNWPNNKIDKAENYIEPWIETSPTLADSDEDGLSDGYGEDKDFDGRITGDSNSDRVWQPGELWSESNPLRDDTDNDGLPDGWEVRFGLNPLDNGTLAFDGSTPNTINGASGDPDGDELTNLQELLAGTDPRTDNSVILQPGEEILIGPVSDVDSIVRGSVTNKQEFTDWKINDLVVLDEFEGDGSGNQGGDTYPAGDGHDTSRDIVAFYARDGGDTSVGGTGEFYFRADFHDLKPYAEEGNLDLYVVIDSGNSAVGEYALPDQIDTGTVMRWEAVVAVYQSNNGAVIVADGNPANNTNAINQALVGTQRRDQNSPDGFRKAYFNSALDAVEFSISRKALTDAGWLGDPATLNFQVFTTRDGTQNSPQGAGDIGGRTDIRDTISDDWLAEDYWRDQGYIGQNSELRTWFNYNGPDRGKRSKVMLLTHGNEPMLTGSEIQDRINDGVGQGYHRMLDVHDAYSAKAGLHITPTLASAIQWASVDPSANKPWRDGPAFNQRIGTLMADDTLELIASTFADSPMPYFSQAYLNDNVSLSNRTLTEIYGTAPSSRVFWIPERIIDEGVLSKVSGLGYTHIFADQFRHILDRFGRSSALRDDGYRVNRFNGLNAIVINDQASGFRFRNTDNGLDINLRQLVARKARGGEQHQLLVLYSDWSDFRNKLNADGYDRNVAWLASRPWIELVGPDQVAAGEVDLSIPPDGSGDQFASLERGNTGFNRKLGPLWLDHATQGNYDFWWFGSAQEESLRDKVFQIRPGTAINRPGDDFFGVQSFGGNGAGIAKDAWDAVSALPDTALGRLGRGTYHAATFLAGWHNEDNPDLRTYSTGAFIYPDTSYDSLAAFSKQAQSQARFAAIYQEVSTWATSPPPTAQAVSLDVDLDGENEYLLRNDRVFALFEASGGRCTAAWSRDPVTGKVMQIVGNPLSASGSETEDEGASNRNPDGSILARRTSAFKDWWAVNGGGGTNQFVNALYTVTAAATGTGWTFTSPGGAITKTITLESLADRLVADYSLGAGHTKLFVRFGLTPDADQLLVRGQSGLNLLSSPTAVTVSNTTAYGLATASVGLDSAVSWQSVATDDDLSTYDTLNMRNQSLVHQVEVESLAFSFTVSLSVSTLVTDADEDGLPADWENTNNLNDDDATGDFGANGDPDEDGLSNMVEWLVGLNPQVVDNSSYPKLAINRIIGGVRLIFPTLPNRSYRLQSSETLGTWANFGDPIVTGSNGLPAQIQIDDTSGQPKRFYRITINAVP
jgi:glycosidase